MRNSDNNINTIKTFSRDLSWNGTEILNRWCEYYREFYGINSCGIYLCLNKVLFFFK